ncbi:MAG: hypothetical protein ACTSV1_05525 [Alphaproteobacteria bacterium]
MTSLYFINEWSVWRFLWAALTGADPQVVAIEPLFPRMMTPLRSVVEWAVASGRAGRAVDACPGLRYYRDFPVTIESLDIFGQTEARMNAFYRFEALDRHVPDYAMACKLAVSNHTAVRQLPVMVLNHMAAQKGAGNVRLVGAQQATLNLYREYFAEFPASFRANEFAKGVINTFYAVAITAFAALWSLSRIRAGHTEPKKVFLMADFIGNTHDMRMFDELADGGDIVIMARGYDAFSADTKARIASYEMCSKADGVFDVDGGLAAMALALRDGYRLWRQCRAYPSDLFYRIACLPYHRLSMRSVFNAYHPKFHWGRDPYNPEHILRRQELRRIGGRAHSCLHGYGALCDAVPAMRFINFDRYYTFGKIIHEKLIGDTWASDMEVVPTGSFGITREKFTELKATPRSGKDIVVYSNFIAALNDDKAVAMIRVLAAEFTDRTVWLQVRRKVGDRGQSKAFVESCTRGLVNVVPTTDGLFDLIARARYAFSDPSTVILENVQFGVKAFMIDVLKDHKKSIYRNFPGLCVTTPAEAVARIHDIESGAWSYPAGKDIEDLVEMGDTHFLDYVRTGMGLAPVNETNREEVA